MRINYNIGEVKLPYSLFICSPAYSGELNCHFVISLIRTCELLKQNGIDYDIYFSVYDSLVARTRNDLVDKFLKSKHTHILMIDSDQGWEPEKVLKMFFKDKEFLTGAVPGRKAEETYALKIHTNENRTPFVKDGLIKCAMNGVAFAMIKRSVFEKIKEKGTYKQEVYPFFQHKYYENGDHYGEDNFFTKSWLDIGGEVWIYPDITFKHGPIEANYHEFLLRQPGGSKFDGKPQISEAA